MQWIRWLALVILILFSAYTLYAVRRENFWRSLAAVMALRWGRHVVADLYIGLMLFSFVVYLNEGSVWIMLLWLLPTLMLGNLVTLVYFVVSFQSLISHFL